ncbi:MAG: serine/threonine-protein phosphatase [Myxococcales bacterium]|nr:serine/threonine-protein phosphatase [Myxococcales bacterium]
MQLEAFAVTATGRRAHNEDAVCARADLGLFVVADGMGGYEGGEIASQVAVATIEELVARTAADADVTWPYRADVRLDPIANEVAVATRLAGARIAARRTGVLAQMGSTVAVLRIDGRRRLVAIGHVGDSRIYRLRAGALEPLTVDHSLWAELVAAGAEPVERDAFPYKHVVTRALGTPSGEPEVRLEPVLADDVYLLCSDGLSEVLAPAVIAAHLAQPPARAAATLVDVAYAAGSRDNISAVVVRVVA